MMKKFLFLSCLVFSVGFLAVSGDAGAEKVAPAKAKVKGSPKKMDVTELKIEDVTKGTGAEAKAGQQVKVHYSGRLLDGKEFDSSHKRNEPFSFRLGAGEVIQGWDKGVAGMKVGGKRRLTIPSSMGYGARGAGNGLIPPNAGLVFDVELLGVN